MAEHEHKQEDAHEQMRELQLLQQRLQLFTAQKQQLQIQLAEVDNALKELSKAKPPVYRMVGEILVEKSPEDLKKELDDQKEELDLRIKTIEKQEAKTLERASELQKEVVGKK